MACNPDEQNRFTVTADAVTGTPALRLAMRATFSPCSPSGIAHPRMTSSMSAASSPGARLIASPITVDASSSGLVPRRVPFGALPTAVRTADTITASFMTCPLSIPVAQQFLDRVRHLAHHAVEQVIGAVDDHQFLGLG